MQCAISPSTTKNGLTVPISKLVIHYSELCALFFTVHTPSTNSYSVYQKKSDIELTSHSLFKYISQTAAFHSQVASYTLVIYCFTLKKFMANLGKKLWLALGITTTTLYKSSLWQHSYSYLTDTPTANRQRRMRQLYKFTCFPHAYTTTKITEKISLLSMC